MTSKSDHPVNDRGTHRRDAFISYSGKDWQFARFHVDVTPDRARLTRAVFKGVLSDSDSQERFPEIKVPVSGW
jgi:hypothetical protein